MKRRMTRAPAHTETEGRRRAKAERTAPCTQGSVTVFLALSFAMIAALLLTIVESCRTVSERLFWQVAVDSSMESLFSVPPSTLGKLPDLRTAVPDGRGSLGGVL